MKTKLCILISVFSFGSITNSFADEGTKTIKSTLQNVTVFFQGAELSHKASTLINKGESEILIEELSPNIDHNSLKITASNGVIITSHEFSIDYLTSKEGSNIEKKLQDSILIYENRVKDLQVKLKTNEDLLNLLQANKSIGGTQNGLSVTELVKMMDYYQTKSVELQNAKRNYEDSSVLAKQRAQILRQQLAQTSSKNSKQSGVLKLTLSSPIATNSNFTISYYTQNSGWTPYYDITVIDTDKPIKLSSKAKVRQTTGLDWNRVNLTLSTSSPNKGKVAPLFNAWFLNFVQPRNFAASDLAAGRVAGLATQNSYSYNDEVVVMGYATMAKEEKSVSQKKVTPLYIVNGVPMEEAEFQTIDKSMIKDVQTLKDANQTALYGSRAANGVVVVTTKDMDDFVSQDETELNLVYNIDIPYTIAGNGKEQTIDLKNYDLSAEYKYYCAPKLDTETFLLAEISGWEKLGLLSGKANVTFGGTYIGESFINTNSTQKTLSLTLGTDKRVSVKREKLQDFSSKKMLGSDRKQEFVYQITVKNNSNKNINLTLKDQYPLSSQKEIEVEPMKETTNPTTKNEDVGVLVWDLNMKPGETKIVKNAYSVKYPKGKPINL